jgi:flagellin
MASVLSTNMASLAAQHNLANAQTNATTSIQRLSSGLRINSAKDDAAGLGISQNLTSQITGANVAAKNANDAISMVQTAEGGMQEVSGMLQRMRELATQGNNDSLSTTQRGYIGTEVVALRDEINKVAGRTTFNGKTLLDGSVANNTGGTDAGKTNTDNAANARGQVVFQTGVSENDTMDVSSALVNISIDSGGANTDGTVANVTTTVAGGDAAGAASSVGKIMTDLGTAIDRVAAGGTLTSTDFGQLATATDNAIGAVSTVRSNLGAMQNRLDHNITNLQSQSENLTAAKSRITDTDYATETAQMSKNQIMQQAATAMLSQANQMPNVVMSLLK